VEDMLYDLGAFERFSGSLGLGAWGRMDIFIIQSMEHLVKRILFLLSLHFAV